MKGKVGILITLVSFMLISCASDGSSAKASKRKGKYANVPQWFFDPNVEGGIGAVGISKIGKAGLAFAKTDALSQARDELSKTISINVKNMIKNFTQEIGVGDDQTVDKVAQQVSKQLSANTISNSVQKNMYINEETEEVYVHVVMDENKYKETLKSQTSSSFKNEKAMHQQMLAKKGQEDLDKEIAKEIEKSTDAVKKELIDIQDKKAE
jgi:hypothetical protein